MSIKKIAIIGGGPSGLVALNEFLHTSIDGSSTINTSDYTKTVLPEKSAFDEIVVFNSTAENGGVWSYSEKPDPNFPESEEYSLPKGVRPNLEPPSDAELKLSSKTTPYVRPISSEKVANGQLWNSGGVYDDLFTNIPNRLMHFTSCFDYNVEGTDSDSNPYYPFVKHPQVLEYIDFFANAFDLKKYVRYNTCVEKVYKKGDKWYVTVCQIDYENKTEKWYTETFDAVVVATGRFNVPFFPKVEGMIEFEKTHPNVIMHSKSFRNCDDFKNKKVLLVGANISSVDLLQYFIPTCKEVWVSSNLNQKVTDLTNEPTSWIDKIMRDKSLNFIRAARLKKFDGDAVEFEDGIKTSNFDKIIFATGYHLYFPFLDIPENENKGYIKLTSGRDDQENYAKNKVDNLYMYTFCVNDPTIAHLGIQHTPLFFMAAEANSIAIAGVWSGTKKLPSKEEQISWCKKRFEGKIKGFQYVSEVDIPQYFAKLQEYGPKNRLDIVNFLKPDEIKNSRNVLSALFYKYVKGELKNN